MHCIAFITRKKSLPNLAIPLRTNHIVCLFRHLYTYTLYLVYRPNNFRLYIELSIIEIELETLKDYNLIYMKVFMKILVFWPFQKNILM